MFSDGVVPGNRNADNIDSELQRFENIYFPSKTLRPGHIRAALLKSFGFGQVGGEVLAIHPDFVLAALSEAELDEYLSKRRQRECKTYRYYHDAMTSTQPFVRVKHEPPYSAQDEKDVYLNPMARASYDPVKNTWRFKEGTAAKAGRPVPTQAERDMAETLKQALTVSSGDNNTTALGNGNTSTGNGFGVDVELVANVNVDNPTFLERNFTPTEIEYCLSQPDPHASFAGRWSAKEAVIKAVSSFNLDSPVAWQGAGAALKDIEILPSASKAPRVVLHHAAQDVVAKAGVKEIKVSISHSGDYAVATAHAL